MRKHTTWTVAAAWTAAALMATAGHAAPPAPPTPHAGAGKADAPKADAPGGVERFDGHCVAAVRVASTRDVLTLRALSDDLWSCGPIRVPQGGTSEVPARFSPAQLEALKASGLAFRVLIPDVQVLIDAERARLAGAQGAKGGGGADGPGWFADYKNYTQISQYIDTLVALRPDLATRVSAGNSLEGRSIYGLKLTSAVGGPNKPAIYFESMQHAREWISGASVMYVADRLVRDYDADANLRRILDTFEVYIIPVCNPDGYEYTWTNNRLWRKNRRPNAGGSFGVDNNRNWGSGWGGEGASTAPNSDTYRGTAPFSEPETQALRDFVLARPNIVYAMDVHSFSQLVLSAYGFTSAPAPDAAMFAELDAGTVQAFEAPYGTDFVGGPTYTTIYPASGVASDWFYVGADRIGHGSELRDTGQFGFVLPPDQIVPSGNEVLSVVRFIADWLIDNTVKFSVVSRPSTIAPDASAPVQVNIFAGASAPTPGTQTLWYRLGRAGPFTPVALTPTDGNSYNGTLPGGPCNALVQYYFSTQTTAGLTFTEPALGTAAPFEAVVAGSVVVLSDGGESDTGWTLGAAGDTATSGQWTRGNPNGTAAQPEDAFAGTNCFFTGQGTPGGPDGAADVDGGFTTLITPTLNLAGLNAPVISYARWYDNSSGASPNQDVFRISVSNNNGASWTAVETVGPSGPQTGGGWFTSSFTVSDLLPPTAQMKLRFVAEDANPGSLVEAAVDELKVSVNPCGAPCVGDWDRNGVVNSTDVSEFINTWFNDQATGGLQADFDGNGISNSTDVSDFINAWFEPC
jgi:hypothetical protein